PEGLLAGRHPATADELPASVKSQGGTWYNHLGGTMAIGCDTEAVKKCPTSFEELLGAEYKGEVAMRGNPTAGEAGFMAVFAASLANGGALDDIETGRVYYKELSDKGNAVPTEAEAGTRE